MENKNITEINKKFINEKNILELKEKALKAIQGYQEYIQENVIMYKYKFFSSPDYETLRELVSFVVIKKFCEDLVSKEHQTIFHQNKIEWSNNIDKIMKEYVWGK